MIVAIASGKGGTGKTTVATNLALSVSGSVYLDCDVEEPNGHLFLKPVIEKEEKVSRLLPRFDDEKCTYCGECANVCQFNALTVLPRQVLLFEEMCHSCGVCAYFCPENAIKEMEQPMGTLRIGKIPPENSSFVEGCLNIGEMMPGPLIAKVKEKVQPEKLNILDAPPGTACPMVEVVRHTDFCLLVTEPTPFGLSDLKLAVEVMRILNQPFGIVINKDNQDSTMMEEYCRFERIPVLLKIPFNRQLAEAYSRGVPAVGVFQEMKITFQNLFDEINIRLNRQRKISTEAAIKTNS